MSTKKHLIVSYKNLSEELLEQFNEAYPDGHLDYLQRVLKPNGDPIFVVPFETDDCSYMVRFDVKIDTAVNDDDLDKVLQDDTGKDDESFDPLSDPLDKDEDTTHTERVLKHGDYEDLFDPTKLDSDEGSDGRDDAMDASDPDDREPTADDLLHIDNEFLSDPALGLATDKKNAKPSSRKTAAKPATTKTATKPATTKTATKPATTKTAAKPATTKTATKPATPKTAAKPATTRATAKAAPKKAAAKPAVKKAAAKKG